MRQEVKGRITRKDAPPSYAEESATSIDTTVLDTVRRVGAGGFKKLLDLGILVEGNQGIGYEFKYTANTHLGEANATKPQSNGFAKMLIAALNHFRFAMYTEWRLGYELTTHRGPLFPE